MLLVHEAPNNPCSEKIMLQKWLQNELHTTIKEFNWKGD